MIPLGGLHHLHRVLQSTGAGCLVVTHIVAEAQQLTWGCSTGSPRATVAVTSASHPRRHIHTGCMLCLMWLLHTSKSALYCFSCRIVTTELAELRATNVAAIRAARAAAIAAGTLTADARGYDTLTVPEVGYSLDGG